MEYLAIGTSYIMNNLQFVLLIMTVMIFFALIIFININIKLTKMNRRYRKLMQGMEGANIEQLLMTHIEEIRQAMIQIDATDKKCKELEGTIKTCVQKVGVVRFNAFEDTGSDLSYAVSMLNAKDDGIVLSSIYGRNESRAYAKPIQSGQSPYFLTEEEKQSLMQAQKNCEK